MTQEEQIASQLLDWVRANADVDPCEIDRRTPLVGPDSVLDSLALVSLTVLIERLRGRPIDPIGFADIHSFASVENIMASYFGGSADAG